MGEVGGISVLIFMGDTRPCLQGCKVLIADVGCYVVMVFCHVCGFLSSRISFVVADDA